MGSRVPLDAMAKIEISGLDGIRTLVVQPAANCFTYLDTMVFKHHISSDINKNIRNNLSASNVIFVEFAFITVT